MYRILLHGPHSSGISRAERSQMVPASFTAIRAVRVTCHVAASCAAADLPWQNRNIRCHHYTAAPATGLSPGNNTLSLYCSLYNNTISPPPSELSLFGNSLKSEDAITFELNRYFG